MSNFASGGIALGALAKPGIPATLAPKQLHGCMPVIQGWESHLASKAMSLVGLVLATMLGIAVLLPDQKIPSALRADRASRSAHKIAGRWINGNSLKLEEELAASLSVRARDARKIAKEAAGQTSPEIVVDQALLALLDGKPAVAAAVLEQALHRSPSDPSLLNDLAVVDLVRADQGDSYNLILALDALERCLQVQPSLREALFNRALVLEKLHLDQEALRAWSRLSTKEEYSSYRRLASLHALSLTRGESREASVTCSDFYKSSIEDADVHRITSESPQEARLCSEEVLLRSWADDFVEHPQLALRSLRVAREIGSSIASMSGDSLLLDSVDRVYRALSSGLYSRDVKLLLQGHASYGRALDLLNAGHFDAAEKQFTRALKNLTAAKSPFAAWALWQISACKYNMQDYRAARDTLQGVIGIKDYYPSLRGRTQWLLGLLSIVNGNPVRAISDYQIALTSFNICHEKENQAAIEGLLAESYVFLGDIPLSWQYRLSALSALKSIRRIGREQVILDEAAEAALRDNKPRIASYFQAEVIRRVSRRGTPQFKIEAHLRRIPIDYAMSDLRAARVDSDYIKDNLNLLGDLSLRRRLWADMLLINSQGISPSDPTTAIKLISEALGIYQTIGYRFRMTSLYAERAACYRRSGRRNLAEADLSEGLAEYRRELPLLSSSSLRKAYIEQSLPLLEEFFLLAAERHVPPINLFVYASDFRRLNEARAEHAGLHQKGLIVSQSTAAFQSRLARFIPRIPDNMMLISFMVLPKHLMRFVFTRGQIDLQILPMTSRTLELSVKKFRNTIGRDSLSEEGRHLFQNLFGGIILNKTFMAIAPDRFLFGLPFSALEDSDGSPLLKNHTVVIVPSLESSLAEGYRRPWSNITSALILTAPTINRSRFADLPLLPEAEREAQEIVPLFPHVRLLTGRGVTRENLLLFRNSFDLIHINTHTVDVDGTPSLVFSEAPIREDELLSPSNLDKVVFKKCRLVTLANCRSANAGSLSEGNASLPQAFITAGVPNVIVALWDIEDSESRAFFSHFYQRLREGRMVAEALRDAQMSFVSVRGRKPEYVWSAFELFVNIQLEDKQEGVKDEL
jgi:tetratricopeptide (TPR) repeat protein